MFWLPCIVPLVQISKLGGVWYPPLQCAVGFVLSFIVCFTLKTFLYITLPPFSLEYKESSELKRVSSSSVVFITRLATGEPLVPLGSTCRMKGAQTDSPPT